MIHRPEEGEKRFRMAFENMNTGMSIVELDGRYSRVNGWLSETLGYSREELEGMNVEDAVPVEEKPVIRGVFSKALNGEMDSHVFQSRCLKKQGGVIRVEQVCSLVRDSRGSPLYFTLQTNDITQQKKKEKALRLSQFHMKAAQKIAQVGGWDRNLETGDTYWSDEEFRIFGYEPGEVVPTQELVERHVHPDDLEAFTEVRQNDFKGKSGFDEEFRIIRKDGEIRTVNAISAIERDESGKAVRIFGTLQDITQRKQSENAIKNYSEKLEQMVDDRTRKLKDVHKELMHRAIEAGRSQLSAMVLHNIGNALTPITVFMEELEKNGTEQVIAYIEKCYGDLKEHLGDLDRYLLENPRGRKVFAYMGKLVDSLKQSDSRRANIVEKIRNTVAHISEIITLQNTYAAKEEEIKVEADLNHLIQDAIAMQKLALEKREIKIKVDLKRGLPKLIIDKNRMMQVIINLIKNSYEAIELPNGSGKEKVISIRTFSDDDGRFGFEIKDTGIGADPEQIKDYFEFGKSSKGSSGFGLYYSRMFVEHNRGTLYFESRGKGQGATITVSFGKAS